MFVAGDGECVECGSVMWAITSDYLQRGLKSCLAHFGSQTFSFIFSSRMGWMWIWVAARMWRMVTLMWLGARVHVTSSEFHETNGCVCFTWPGWRLHWILSGYAAGAKETSCTFLQQVQLSHASRWLCVSLHRRSELSFVSCFRLASRWPSEAIGNNKCLEWEKPAGDQRFAGKNLNFLLKPSRFMGSDRHKLAFFFLKNQNEENNMIINKILWSFQRKEKFNNFQKLTCGGCTVATLVSLPVLCAGQYWMELNHLHSFVKGTDGRSCVNEVWRQSFFTVNVATELELNIILAAGDSVQKQTCPCLNCIHLHGIALLQTYLDVGDELALKSITTLLNSWHSKTNIWNTNRPDW